MVCVCMPDDLFLSSAETYSRTNKLSHTEDFMLCKNENRDPAHCLKEGRRVTRCATDL